MALEYDRRALARNRCLRLNSLVLATSREGGTHDGQREFCKFSRANQLGFARHSGWADVSSPTPQSDLPPHHARPALRRAGNDVF